MHNEQDCENNARVCEGINREEENVTMKTIKCKCGKKYFVHIATKYLECGACNRAYSIKK